MDVDPPPSAPSPTLLVSRRLAAAIGIHIMGLSGAGGCFARTSQHELLEDPHDLMSKLRTRNVLPDMKRCSEIRLDNEKGELRSFHAGNRRLLPVTFDSLPYVHNSCVTGRVGSRDDVPDHPGAETQLRTCLSEIEESQWEKMAVLASRATDIDDDGDGGNGGAETQLQRAVNLAGESQWEHQAVKSSLEAERQDFEIRKQKAAEKTTLTEVGDDGGGGDDGGIGGAETQLQRAVNLAGESQWEHQAVKSSLEAERKDLETRKQKSSALHESLETAKSPDFAIKGTETQLIDATKRTADPLWERYAERASLEAEISTLQAKKTILKSIARQKDDGEHDNQDNHNHGSSSHGGASDNVQDTDDGGSVGELIPQNTMESQVLLTQTYQQASAPATQNFALNVFMESVDSFGGKSNEDEHRSSSASGEASGDAQDSDGEVVSTQAQDTMESEVLLTQTDRQASASAPAPAVRNFDTQDEDEGWITKQSLCNSPAKPFTQCHRSAQDELDSLLASSPESNSNSPLLLPRDADSDGRGGGDDDNKERSESEDDQKEYLLLSKTANCLQSNDDDQKRKVSMSPAKSASSEDIDEPSRKPSLKRMRIALSGPVAKRGNSSKGYQRERVTVQQQRSDGWLDRRTEMDRLRKAIGKREQAKLTRRRKPRAPHPPATFDSPSTPATAPRTKIPGKKKLKQKNLADMFRKF